jgi:hypothetical protein
VKKIFLLCLTIAGIAALITGGTASGPQIGDCVEVSNNSVHAYYEPAFESALVGWFIEGEELTIQHTEGDWWMVSGRGKDASLRETRMTGWVQSSYLKSCSEGDV